MIRLALAFLGLSAGAVSAQTPVQGASVSDICGRHIEVVVDDADCASAEPATQGRSTPDVPASQAQNAIVPVRAVEQRGAAAIDSSAGKGLAAVKRGIGLPDCEGRFSKPCSHPFERDVVFAGTLDGSDPSAMFCP